MNKSEFLTKLRRLTNGPGASERVKTILRLANAGQSRSVIKSEMKVDDLFLDLVLAERIATERAGFFRSIGKKDIAMTGSVDPDSME